MKNVKSSNNRVYMCLKDNDDGKSKFSEEINITVIED